MFNIGPLELLFILIIALLVIGPKKLPELARSLGKAFGDLKRTTDELKSDFSMDIKSSIDLDHLTPSNHNHLKKPDQSKEEPKPQEEKDLDGR